MKKIVTYLTIFILIFNVIFSLNTVQAHNVELDPEDYINMPIMIFGGAGSISVSSRVNSSYELYYQHVEITDEIYSQINQKIEEAEEYYDEEKTKLNEERANLEVVETEYQRIVNDSTATQEEKTAAKTAYETAVNDYNTHVNTFNSKIEEYNQTVYGLTPTYIDGNWTKTIDTEENGIKRHEVNIDTSEYTGEIHFVLWAKLVTESGTYYDEQIYRTQGTKEITITLNKTTADMKVGETLKLTATTNSSDNITWTSNKTDIATVSADGTVTAKAKGVATITATVGEKSASCIVTVNNPTAGTDETITINKTSANIKIDETIQLTATSSTNSKITWTSSDSSIATVSSEGNVKGIKKGTAIITAKGSEKIATCKIIVSSKESTDGTEEDGNWTDFSNAKFELKKDGTSDAIIEISNVTPNSQSYYYLYINSNNTIPDVNNIDFTKSDNLLSIQYDTDKKVFRNNNSDALAKFIEVNQDLYMSIIERESSEYTEKVVYSGKKLERFKEPQYSDAFFATFISKTGTQIVTTFTHGDGNDRKMQIKVGKITDKEILRKIKNQDSSGFADLLSFAKSNNGIYDKIVESERNKGGYAIEYKAEEADVNKLIDLKGLENDEYYFLYVKTEDENGKYISQEGVTLAQANVYSSSDWWSLHFYGASDFKWADFGNVQVDNTTAQGTIPKAGLDTIIWITAALIILLVVSYKQYQKNNF